MLLSYLIVGSGYRSKFYARIAATYPELFSAMFLCRSEEKADLMRRETGIPATCSREECGKFRPDLVVVVVNKAGLTDVCIEWAQRGYPVLVETPAAMTTAMAHSQMTIVLTSRSRKKSRRWPFQTSTCSAKFTAPTWSPYALPSTALTTPA